MANTIENIPENTNEKKYLSYEGLVNYDALIKEVIDTKADISALSSKADKDHDHDDLYYTEAEMDAELDAIDKAFEVLSSAVKTNRNETIIGLSVDGTTVTYIKGDGSEHTFETQDTNTTYSLGTDEVTGLTRLYATIGSAEDGTMTQKAIKTELDKKVGVSVDDSQGTLVFTI